jgi:elongation factor G
MRLFTVFGPSQSGKTTLVEALAALETHAPRRFEVPGVATASRFGFMGEDWTAIDVAGGTENLAAAGPALAASDAAILCAPADADAAVLSAPFLRMADAAGTPVLIFVNGVDRASDRISAVVAALQAYARHHVVLRQIPLRSGDGITGAVDLISERAWQYREGEPSALIELPPEALSREQGARTELLESFADFDDALLEQLIEDRKPMTGEVYDVASRTMQHADLIPAVIGSAVHRNGILRLMKLLRHEAPEVGIARDRLSRAGDAVALGVVGDVIKHLGKAVVIRALGDGVAQGERLGGASVGALVDLDARTQIPQMRPGEVGMTVKSDHLSLGRAYTPDGNVALPDWTRPHAPRFRRMLIPLHERDEARLSTAIERLAEVDPGLAYEQDERSGHFILAAQGPQHLRRLADKLAGGFGIELEQSPVPPSLRETVRAPVEWHHRHRKQTGGAGQFADVVIDLVPQQRGDGFRFEEQVKGGAVPRNHIPAVEAGVRDALLEGPGGHPVVDVSVVLKDGKSHSVDSSDFAFRTAGKNAVREAMASVGTITLQPIMRVRISAPSVFAGGLVPTISGLKGQVLGFDADPEATGWDTFDCLLPMAAEDALFNALASATRGTAWYAAVFDHYQEMRHDDIAAFEAAHAARA